MHCRRRWDPGKAGGWRRKREAVVRGGGGRVEARNWGKMVEWNWKGEGEVVKCGLCGGHELAHIGTMASREDIGGEGGGIRWRARNWGKSEV